MSGATPREGYEAALERVLGKIQLAAMWSKRPDGSTDLAEYLAELSKLSRRDPPDDDAEQPP